MPCSLSAPDSSSRPGGILAILAANKPDHPGTSYRALKEQKKGSLSALLAANRAQAAAQEPPLPAGVMLSEATITAANAAIGSSAGVVRASVREGLGVSVISGGLTTGGDPTTGGVSGKGALSNGKRDARDGSAEQSAIGKGKGGVGQSEEPSISARGGEPGQPQSALGPVESERRSGDVQSGGRGARVSGSELSGFGSRGREAAGGSIANGDGGKTRGAGAAASKDVQASDAQSKEMRKRANAMEFLKQVGWLYNLHPSRFKVWLDFLFRSRLSSCLVPGRADSLCFGGRACQYLLRH